MELDLASFSGILFSTKFTVEFMTGRASVVGRRRPIRRPALISTIIVVLYRLSTRKCGVVYYNRALNVDYL